jgi:hypothetical protein
MGIVAIGVMMMGAIMTGVMAPGFMRTSMVLVQTKPENSSGALPSLHRTGSSNFFSLCITVAPPGWETGTVCTDDTCLVETKQ